MAGGGGMEVVMNRRDLTTAYIKGTNPALKKSLNIPEIYAEMFGRFH